MRTHDNGSALRLGDATIHPQRNLISVNGESRLVTSREMDVLMVLLASSPEVALRDEILDTVWKDVVVNDDALTLVVSRLRQALGDDPRRPRFIETIPTRGYRLLQVPGADMPESPPQESRTARYRWIIGILLVLLVLVAVMLVQVGGAYKDVSGVSRVQGVNSAVTKTVSGALSSCPSLTTSCTA